MEYEKEGRGQWREGSKDALIPCILKNKKLAACTGFKSIMSKCPRRGVLQNV